MYYGEDYNEKVDTWAVGVTAFKLLSKGEYPFDGEEDKQVIEAILKYEPTYKLVNASDNAIHFMKMCLNKNIAERYSAANLI